MISGIHVNTLIRDYPQGFWASKIIFHPSGLYRLTEMPIHELFSNLLMPKLFSTNKSNGFMKG
jgi:hypothetical protein